MADTRRLGIGGELTALGTKIDGGGLRCTTEAGGSSFAAKNTFSAGTMSCFLCGVHRPRSVLRTRKMFGKWQYICDPGCLPKANVPT